MASSEQKLKIVRRERRKKHIRKKIIGTSEKPRLSVYRSNKHIYAQLIDDTTSEKGGNTLVFVSSTSKEFKEKMKGKKKSERAFVVGEKLAQEALKKGIKEAVLDRGWARFHGRLKSLSEGAKKSGFKL